jgi:lipopolysaccharide/colanic/teichoic acid biosynthesis glycosyltransferase
VIILDPNKVVGRLCVADTTGTRSTVDEQTFQRSIAIERKRTERSRIPFMLMLLETGEHHSPTKRKALLDSVMSALLLSTRESDVIGWYKHEVTIGVMFTDLIGDKNSMMTAILARVSAILRGKITVEQFSQLSISLHFFPDDWDHENPCKSNDAALYPDLSCHDDEIRSLLGLKRAVDIIGSLLILTICAPLLLMIALVIKVSSKGPILFRQSRVGQYGRSFMFLKFRSMYVGNDPTTHKEYVTKLIAGTAERETQNGKSAGVYKLTNDKRITPIGKILRKTSLDELPQLFNVLKGEMSLVGPRPAIPYEVAAYQTWHRRRVLEVKPGITGLWQVNGRSRVKFDDMVRLDLQYAMSWTPWLDFKILMQTPRAVIMGAGAL